MTCHIHTRDSSWDVDLIWKYLHETTTPGQPVEGWYKYMDPFGLLNDRHRVYGMLVGDPAQTKPSLDQRAKSTIPWNQNNEGMVKAFNSSLACGSVVKLAFRKYMGWGGGEPKFNRDVGRKGFDAVAWLTGSLGAGKPVRAYLRQKDHYVGIVGYRTRGYSDAKRRVEYEFLVMEPWSGGAASGETEATYAGIKTKFLGIMKEDGSKLKYDGYEITTVEGHHPMK